MALPPREDGGANHRHEARQRRLGRCRVPPVHPLPADLSGPLGDQEPPVTEPGAPEAPTPARAPRLAMDALDRYLPVIAIIAMVATYLQIRSDIALIIIGGVWLIATRITRSHRFLGLSLTEGLAWAATILIALILIFSVLGP